MNNKGFILINLLPYREKIKASQIKKFSILMASFALFAGVEVFATHVYLGLKIDSQEYRNKFIENENKKLDSDIASISSLKDEIKVTLAKRKIVESLQINRVDGVNIINEVANNLPDDVYLKSVKKDKDRLMIVGLTNSNNKVSNYMTRLNESSVFINAGLIEIKSIVLVPQSQVSKGKQVQEEVKINEFTITVEMRKTEEQLKKIAEEQNLKHKNKTAK